MTANSSEWFARYRFRQPLGQGGMGVIYLAEDKSRDNTLCVVKQLLVKDSAVAEFDEAVRFFKREIDILRQLNHPGIVKLIDDHITADHKYFLVMDYVPGNNLEIILKNCGSLSSEAVVEIGIQCCDILEYLHTHQPPIIYRDLKPSNLMLTPDGQIVFIDFGIARSLLPRQVATKVITSGYSPAEQYAGQPEPRSDLYALGATLGHIVTGVKPRPIEVSNPASLKTDVMPALDDLITRLTATNIEDRPATARAVQYELYRIYHNLHPNYIVPEAALITPQPSPKTKVNTSRWQQAKPTPSVWDKLKHFWQALAG